MSFRWYFLLYTLHFHVYILKNGDPVSSVPNHAFKALLRLRPDLSCPIGRQVLKGFSHEMDIFWKPSCDL